MNKEIKAIIKFLGSQIVFILILKGLERIEVSNNILFYCPVILIGAYITGMLSVRFMPRIHFLFWKRVPESRIDFYKKNYIQYAIALSVMITLWIILILIAIKYWYWYTTIYITLAYIFSGLIFIKTNKWE